jgi:magnesium chelatase subunit H
MQKRTSAARPSLKAVIVTLDNHLSSAIARIGDRLAKEIPGLSLSVHVASSWAAQPGLLQQCLEDIAAGDIIIVNMLFLEEHIHAVKPALEARRDACDAMIAFMSAGEVIKLTKLGRFKMDGSQGSLVSLLKRLRGTKKPGATAGAQQIAMLKRIPQILRFIPGKAQDVRAYFMAMQYWLAGSEENICNLVRYLVSRYADGERHDYRALADAQAPKSYPETGVYHPRMRGLIADMGKTLPAMPKAKGTIGLLLMRSYVLSGDTGHYDGVIAALEARGLSVVPAFATGLDSRPAIDKFFMRDGKAVVDAVVSLSGFSLVGGPAYNDAKSAEDMLARLDVPYIAAQPLEFQTLEEWESSERGLHPIEATMMVAIPEIDGAGSPIVFGGRSGRSGQGLPMRVHAERASMLADRVAKLVALRRTRVQDRKVAIVIFNFPPNAGATGTAAFLSVFESLFNTLKAMKGAGYAVDLPASVDDLRDRLLNGNAERYGADANVLHRIPADDHVRRETWLSEIEAQWGPAPGKKQSDGSSIHVLGIELGNVLVSVQPAFGYEGDPMRLLFEKSFTPTHAFSAFYRYLREDFGAHAILHFGTHGALEFMPGKQTGLSQDCWPDRLIRDVPNFYLYAANNPSEGTIAKRRGNATLVSYMTPPLAQAGLYRGLLDLKSSIERWRALEADAPELPQLAELIQAQAAAVDLAQAEPQWTDPQAETTALQAAILELEYTLIPHGLHVVGEAMTSEERAEILNCAKEAGQGEAELAEIDRLLGEDHETGGLLRALDGRFIRPVPGGDVIRNPAILPTGRNLHGFDPFRMPSPFAVADGARQAALLLDTHVISGKPLPETVALVLWGTDNLKSEGGPIAQALALMGAKPRFDSFGRLAGADLIPLTELGRPRVDVMMTLSGIFRDLLPLQTKMLAEAAYLAATADEPAEENFVRKHALLHMKETGCDLETAALRVFSNADGAYGANVNYLVDSGSWDNEDELAEVFTKRKSFAHGRNGHTQQRTELMASVLKGVDLAYQNLESVELGVTTIDHYFDSLGGISRAVQRQKGQEIPVYIGDQTRGKGAVRTLADQVALEARTRVLNPKWYEGMLKHGHEGVRHIECHLTNTVGWSATTGQVAPWVYQQFTQTYVLDETMRERLAALNPKAAAKVVSRLLEASRREFWRPDAQTLEALQRAGEELEDRLEGIGMEVAA